MADTEAWALDAQVERWRGMSSMEKWSLVADLCRDVEAIARVGIHRDHPDADEAEIRWHLLARRFGEETAASAFGSKPTR